MGINKLVVYEYMDGCNKFTKSTLAPKYAFYSSVKDQYITMDEYGHAENVWQSFNCTTVKDYSDLCLKTGCFTVS